MKARNITISLLLFLLACSQSIEKKYYDNGQLEYQVDLKNKKRQGPMYTYYKDGTLESHQNWKNGLRDGKQVFMHKNGSKKIEAYYEVGRQTGESKTFYESGILKSIGKFDNDVRIGEHKLYYQSGKIQETQLFDSAGNLVNFNTYDTSGELAYDERFAIFYPKRDTLIAGERYEAEVRLSSRAYNKNKMIVGSLTDDFELSDTLEVLEADDFVFYYDTVFNRVGSHIVSGHIHDIGSRGDTTIINAIPFQQKFYVKSSE